MKFKLIYLYGIIFIAVMVTLIIISKSNPSKKSDKENVISIQKPKDDLSNSLGIQNQNPSSANVSKEVFEKLDRMKKLADAKPPDTLRVREYADFLAAAHQPDEAIKYYEKILTVDKKRKDIYLAITLIYYNQSKLDKAEEITNQILKLFPKDAMATYNLGAIEATKGNKVKAREIWEKLIASDPDNETAILAKNSIDRI